MRHQRISADCHLDLIWLPPTFQYDRIGTKLLDEMGVETPKWGSDYPHADGAWPDSSKYVDEQFADLPAEVTRKLTCENAGRFYGLIA